MGGQLQVGFSELWGHSKVPWGGIKGGHFHDEGKHSHPCAQTSLQLLALTSSDTVACHSRYLK